MKIKTAKLKDHALDYAVAICEGYLNIDHTILAQTWVEKRNARGVMVPCPVSSLTFTTGQQGDDIIDREGIDCLNAANMGYDDKWMSGFPVSYGNRSDYSFGATRREAAMRCYVLQKLGDEVEIPDSLLDTY